MPIALASAGFAGYPSFGSANRSRSPIGSDLARTGCVGDGGVPDPERTWSDPVVGA